MIFKLLLLLGGFMSFWFVFAMQMFLTWVNTKYILEPEKAKFYTDYEKAMATL